MLWSTYIWSPVILRFRKSWSWVAYCYSHSFCLVVHGKCLWTRCIYEILTTQSFRSLNQSVQSPSSVLQYRTFDTRFVCCSTCCRRSASPRCITDCHSPGSKFCITFCHTMSTCHAVLIDFYQMAMNSRSWHLLHVQNSYYSKNIMFGPLFQLTLHLYLMDPV